MLQRLARVRSIACALLYVCACTDAESALALLPPPHTGSPMPLSNDAVSELRGGVATAAMVFIDAAQASAAKRGSADVEDQDFDAVLKAYKAQKTPGKKKK